MGHDWVFDVLRDLKSYAMANGLPALAAQADVTLAVAEAEIAALDPDKAPPDTGPAPH